VSVMGHRQVVHKNSGLYLWVLIAKLVRDGEFPSLVDIGFVPMTFVPLPHGPDHFLVARHRRLVRIEQIVGTLIHLHGHDGCQQTMWGYLLSSCETCSC